jgi:KDO2-lipid IV(A) lauroyltransferase
LSLSDLLTRALVQPIRLLGRMPPGLARAMMRPLGPLSALALPSRRRIAERNFELCYPELSEAERRRLLRRHFRFLGEMLAESAIAWCRPGRLDERFGTVEGFEHLERAIATGRGVLVLTGHSTSLEFGGRLLCERTPTWGVYRPQRNRTLEAFQNNGRLRYAQGMFRNNELKAMVQHLRAGKLLWYAPDQDFGPQRSVFVPFFGLPAATATGIVNMARVGKAVVVPMYPLRDPETGRVKVIIEPAFENFPSGDDAHDLARFNAFLERQIRLDPAQYFWVHRRFKSTPEGEEDRYRGIRRRRSQRRRRQSRHATEVRVLFAPASGPGGSGEYYRCLALARAFARQCPRAAIDFVLHREARVERDERFSYHELSATPARAGEEVLAVIEHRRPAVAVFDCTGRVATFRGAQQLGARVVFVSNRPRKRLKGFRPRQMRWTDLHVVLDSTRETPRLRVHERALSRMFPLLAVETVSAIVPEPDESALPAPLREAGKREPFALFVAGGGGYEHAGRPVPEIFLDAARRFHAASGLAAVVVMGPQYRGEIDAETARADGVTVVRALPTAALGALLARARLAVIGAGNMLSSQARAAGIPLVVTATGGRDQPRRVRRLRKLDGVVGARLDAASLAAAARSLLDANSGQRRPPLPDGTARVAERLVELATTGRVGTA